MHKKFYFSLVLAVLIFGAALALPKNLNELPVFKNPFSPKFLGLTTSETTIILTGDVMLGRSVMAESLSRNDPAYPFRNVADALQKADLVFANLETPVTDGCQTTNSGMIFCTDPKMIDGLKFAGVDIVNLANNHTKNYGEDGLTQTKNFLTNAGISFVGAENLVVRQIGSIKFGFLGFNLVDKKPAAADYQLIRDSRRSVDVLIAMIHWGNEYTSDPTPAQKEVADTFIKNGVDVVVGGHPHWVQGIDTIEGKPIFYSLGNFIFDQPWSEETKKGLAIRLTYKNDNLSKIEEMPIYMESFAQPKFIK